MAIVNSLAKTQVEAGMPPYLSAQLQRGQVLKKTIVYKAGTAATYALLKEKYDFVLTITNSAAIAANKQFVIVMDLVIP